METHPGNFLQRVTVKGKRHSKAKAGWGYIPSTFNALELDATSEAGQERTRRAEHRPRLLHELELDAKSA